MLLCAYGRVVAHPGGWKCRFVDAVTGALLPRDAVKHSAIDTSGALAARDESERVIALGSPDSAGHALPDMRGEDPRSFRYGVCALHLGGYVWRVMRFDAAPDAQPNPTPGRKSTKRE